ncbi:PadR family transcriptional regulator [Agromyces silvae]|uniref:PadR family transcriptional regulator n=1 Tax=Agromyces silvae TaxID=3388266 RepID=UPI00280BBF5B|nr:PadR family transcriptional regulator [Agromyces protaetiae]
MAVRDALLSILLVGPAYGFQLHGELAARTGGRRAINVGQTYGTLDRLAERGLIEPAGETDDGLPLHRLTEAGRVAALAWLHGTDASVSDPWDETVERVLIASSLPGVSLTSILGTERERWAARRHAAQATAEASARLEPAAPPAASVLTRHAGAIDAARAAALIDWLDEIAAARPAPFGFSPERPRRGRRPAAQPATQPASA